MKDLREKRKCLNCGKEILVRRSSLKNGRGKYCSRSCKSKYDNHGFKKGHGRFLSDEKYREIGKKISKALKGRPLSEDHKKKLSIVKKGKKLAKSHILNLSRSQIKRWSVIPKKKYPKYVHCRNKKYLQWRSDVFTRDNWTCQTCGKRGVFLEAHYVRSWSHFPKLRFDLNNGVTLCKDCHKLTNNYKNKGVQK